MSGMRRSQAVGLTLGLLFIYFLFFSGSGSNTDFRKTTEASLSRRRGILRGALSDKELTAQTNHELQMILDRQKERLQRDEDQMIFDTAPVHGNHPYTSTISFDDDEVSIGGRKTMPKEKPKYPVDTAKATHATDVAADGKGEETAYNGNKVEKAKDDGEDMARQELQSILKKSPIIIFSKSYCPYSKRAKSLLLETYTITPAPYVVELDLMTTPVPKPHGADEDDDAPAPTLGRKLQDLLATLTGRRTVPNIMINAQSLGGSDDIVKMHMEGTLEEEIKKMGGKRIVSVEKKHKDGK
ncbi:uncharacterized protein Z519_03811 [Cladophialophora bantiana CBS 173.52]|uniref:Glutaredoxin domain-containing protein n=1 Tax=Cladophialophora bantiana (strain ATCC 10958 / CBS 173.52 / CDC B-1940 / NIH 8579) TaxID=1442370 RepID=A0A0D2G9C6_CLAB1|nr:uncharacterized protein Z519_03811 [Cladophialophora bantiana CBS 173.52]KIW95227.1 hypothetical protein Z519_03811 [Cladophialophora bantiana CBS 173.52]